MLKYECIYHYKLNSFLNAHFVIEEYIK
ncbi:hypothetical protein JJQ60_17555 [Aquimarina mytili]|uniref:Uncharacterized protein n=1 Tax=Aquimarina mytili TaxID=874423 RepID=A0A937D7B6_9FLAO|nr:hypothetical protein [Aquimarina mytili]